MLCVTFHITHAESRRELTRLAMVDLSSIKARFASGLNGPAKIASWGVAIGAALYLAQRKQQQEAGSDFKQQEDWNKKVLDKSPAPK